MGEEQKGKFIYDEQSETYVYNDGIYLNETDLVSGFNIYYGWVCEKVEKEPDNYSAWKEMFAFLSLEKYRSYVEKDDFRIKLLEIGMLIYINQAIEHENYKINVLGYRQAVKWGYPSVILMGKMKFNDDKRYLRFIFKLVNRYYVKSAVKRFNMELFAFVGKFDEFLISLVAISLIKKKELVSFGAQSPNTGKNLFTEDSKVEWDWLFDELKKADELQEFKKNLNVLHVALNDYLFYKLENAAECTFEFWRQIIDFMEDSEKNWLNELANEEKVLLKNMKNKSEK